MADIQVTIEDAQPINVSLGEAVNVYQGGGGAGGAVDSVNGKTGHVALDPDDLDDTSTDHKFVTSADITNLSNLSGTNTGDQDLSGYALLTSPGLLGRYVGVNAQTGTTYTPVLSDEGKLVTLTNSAAITVTLPQDSDLAFHVGASFDSTVLGAGMATFVAGTGATVNVADTAVTRKTNSVVTAIKVAANTWLVAGDLT